jgi:c-di-GMP-binding flagellar brake protein YcgR
MDKFRLNSKVELIDQDGHGTEGTLYEMDKGHIFVSVVPGGPGFKLLRPEDRLEVVVYDTKNLVSFQGILESRDSGDFMVYKVRIASEFTKFQRREYVRIPYSGVVQFSLQREVLASSPRQVRQMMRKNEGDLGFRTAHTVDLSGGGIRIRSWDRFAIGQEMMIVLKLDDEEIVTRAEVRHGYVDLAEGVTQYFYGIMFKGISENDIDRIVKFVFLMMRKVRPV